MSGETVIIRPPLKTLSGSTRSMTVDLSPGRRLSAIWADFLRGSVECTPSERRVSLARVKEDVMEEFEGNDMGLGGVDSQGNNLINAIAMLSWEGSLDAETDSSIAEKVAMISSEILELDTNQSHVPATSFLRGTPSTSETPTRFSTGAIVSMLPISSLDSILAEASPPLAVSLPTAVDASKNPLSPQFISPMLPSTSISSTGRTIHDRRPLTVDKPSKNAQPPVKNKPKAAKVDSTKKPAGRVKKVKVLKGSKAPGYTPRPANAWILYRSEQIRVLKVDNPEPTLKLPQSDVSKYIAAMWRDESPVVKEYYERQADIKKEEHRLLYPEYRFCPVRKINPQLKPEAETKAPASKLKAAPKKRVKASIRPGASTTSRNTRSLVADSKSRKSAKDREAVRIEVDTSYVPPPVITRRGKSLSPPVSARPDLPLRSNTFPEDLNEIGLTQYQGDHDRPRRQVNDFTPITEDPVPEGSIYSPRDTVLNQSSPPAVREKNDEEVQEASYPEGGRFYPSAADPIYQDRTWVGAAPSSVKDHRNARSSATKPWYAHLAAETSFHRAPVYTEAHESSPSTPTSKEYRRQISHTTTTIVEEAEGGASSYTFGAYRQHWTASERDYSLPSNNEYKPSFGNEEWANVNGGHIEFLDLLDYPPITPGSAPLKRRASEAFQQNMFDIPKRASMYHFPRRG